MKTRVLLFAAIAATTFTFVACGNKQAKTNETAAVEQSGAMEIDSLLANAETLADQAVTIEGVCTHACKHGATKIFLMGSDDTQMIRVEAGKLGSFDTKCVNSIVRVNGTLKEQRVDEAYLQQWEAQLKAANAEKHRLRLRSVSRLSSMSSFALPPPTCQLRIERDVWEAP